LFIRKYPFHTAFLILAIGLAAYVFIPMISPSNGLPVIKKAPDFTLPNLEGKPVQASSNAGKVVLMEFIFTSCPDICPTTTANMVRMQQELKRKDWFGSKVQFVAVTFDPVRDTPEVFREYAQRMGIDPSGWHLLRGDEALTKQIASEYGILVQKTGEGEFVHSVTSLTLIDARRQIRNVYEMGEDMDNDRILADIASLVKEQSG